MRGSGSVVFFVVLQRNTVILTAGVQVGWLAVFFVEEMVETRTIRNKRDGDGLVAERR